MSIMIIILHGHQDNMLIIMMLDATTTTPAHIQSIQCMLMMVVSPSAIGDDYSQVE
jgi:hypothetical protein